MTQPLTGTAGTAGRYGEQPAADALDPVVVAAGSGSSTDVGAPGEGGPARGRARIGRTALRAAVVGVGVLLLGVAAVVVAAWATARPPVFLAAGLLAVVGSGVVGGRWIVRGVISPRRDLLAWGMTGVVVLTVAGVGLMAAVPFREVGRPAAVPGERFWELPTGTRARYVEIPARGDVRSTPVVFVHGGPGTPDLLGDAAFFGRLADDGFDVYLYDQVGAGGSSRLPHPEGYGLDRDVADLEAVRNAIGAQQLVLIGHSYGALIVAGYLAAHPERVARIVFISPASLDPTDASGSGVRTRLDVPQLTTLYARVLHPRNLLVYALLQVNPDAAHALAGDAEMDGQNDRVYAISEPGLHCAGSADPDPPTGLGFYRLQYPQSASAPRDPDLRPALIGNATPALVVKGSCDYLSWGSAVTYLQTLRDVQLVYLRGGHNTYQDAPEEVLATLRAFAIGDSLPVPPRGDATVPSDYEGPS